MSRSYDSGEDTTHITPFAYSNSRCLEYTAHAAGFYVFAYVDGTSNEIVYCYGDDDSWSSATITGAAAPVPYDTANIDYVSIKVCPNDEYVHFAFVSNNAIFYARLDDPDNPVTGSFHTFQSDNQGNPNTKFQRVDDDNNTKSTVSITVDDSTVPALNGADRPHIVWDENNGGTWEVWYNYGDQGPGALEFNHTLSVNLADGAYPTIINIMNKGRLPHCYFIDSNGDVAGLRCTPLKHPAIAANWTGPTTGVNAAEVAIVHTGGVLSTINDLSVSYYFDNDEFVLVSAVEDSVGVYTRLYQAPGNPSWKPQHTVTGYDGDPVRVELTNLRGANPNIGLSSFRLFIMDDDGEVEHGVEELDGNSDLVWDTNTNWYVLADTTAEPSVPIASEWRGLEHNDVANVYKRTHVLWKEEATNNLWFTQTRENTPPIITRDSPSDGAVLDETSTIVLDWTPIDTESDTQDDYDVEVADNNDFTSPVVDPGWAGPGTSTSQHSITGSTLSADTLYYWRVRLKDDEKGDEYDPYSTGDWPIIAGYFSTTPQLEIVLGSYSIESDQDIYIDMRLKCAMDDGESCPDAELDDGVTTDYAQYQYSTDNGDSWSAWTNMTIISGECTSAPTGPLTTSNGGTPYTLAWNADSDLNALQTGDFYGLIRYRVRGQYDSDSKSLGFTDWVQYPEDIEIDFKAPVVSCVWPDGDDIGDVYPTLIAAITDNSPWESKFELDTDPGFGSVEAGHDSGWVSGALSFTPTTALSTGTWYWRVTARDTFDSTNNTDSDNTSFTVKDAGFIPTILDDGSNTVILKIVEDTEVVLRNAMIEYENIRNDFVETDTLQNIPEYRGHHSLEISLEVLFTDGGENQTDVKRVHTWQRDETKLTFTDSAGLPLTIGDSAVTNYVPNKFKITELTPTYRPGIVGSFSYMMRLREVPT
jgi:hypothetical protein